MVLVDAAIAWRDRKIAKWAEEAREEGRAEVRADLEAWYARMEAAKARGEPFDEPPPGVNGRANSA